MFGCHLIINSLLCQFGWQNIQIPVGVHDCLRALDVLTQWDPVTYMRVNNGSGYGYCLFVAKSSPYQVLVHGHLNSREQTVGSFELKHKAVHHKCMF